MLLSSQNGLLRDHNLASYLWSLYITIHVHVCHMVNKIDRWNNMITIPHKSFLVHSHTSVIPQSQLFHGHTCTPLSVRSLRNILSSLMDAFQLTCSLAQEKCSSNWLTVLHMNVNNYCFCFNHSPLFYRCFIITLWLVTLWYYHWLYLWKLVLNQTVPFIS